MKRTPPAGARGGYSLRSGPTAKLSESPVLGNQLMNVAKDKSSESGSISTTLLDQVSAERPEAWERLVDLYSPLIYRWCRQAGMAEQDTADLLQEVFSAVLCHLPDFRHRGPVDIMLARDGNAKLLDLGLARFYAEPLGGEVTDARQAMGTADYIAPEQIDDSRARCRHLACWPNGM